MAHGASEVAKLGSGTIQVNDEFIQ